MHDLVDVGVLEDIVKEKRKEWQEQDFKGGCNLPALYELDFAIAIHVYTLGGKRGDVRQREEGPWSHLRYLHLAPSVPAIH